MPSLIAPYTLPSENTTEAQLFQNFSQMYILMGKALYSRNECCNNQLKTIFFPDNSFSQVHSHFSRFFNKIIKFQYFSRTGKTVVIFPGAVGTLLLACKYFQVQQLLNFQKIYTGLRVVYTMQKRNRQFFCWNLLLFDVNSKAEVNIIRCV